MDRDPPPPRSSSIPFAAGGNNPRSPMVRGATSSPMLTLSSSSPSSPSAQSHRRYYPSLYPPPLPGRLASGSGSTSTGGGGYGSSSRFQLRRQIPPPPPATAGEERPAGRPRTTHGLPNPFLSELEKIRRVGASLFGALDSPSPPPPATRHGGSQHRHRQPWTPLSSIPNTPAAGMPPPVPSRRFSAGYYYSSPPQMQPAPSTGGTAMAPPLPTPRFSGAGGILSESPPPSWAWQQQQHAHPPNTAAAAASSQQDRPWSTDLSALSSSVSGVTNNSAIFATGSVPPPAPQQQMPAKASSFTDLAPLPGGCGFSGLTTPSHTNGMATTMFGSLSRSPAGTAATTAAASASDTMNGHVQPSSSSESELPPLPLSLLMHPEDLPFWQHPSSAGNNNSYYGTETGTTGYTATGSEEEPTRLQAPPTTNDLLQVKQEPVVFGDVPPCKMDPVYVALDDDEKFLNGILQSIQPSTDEAASLLPNQAPLSSDGWFGDVEGSGQSWDMEAMLQAPASMYNNKVNAGASGGIPMNCDSSMLMSQQQQMPPLQQEGDLFSSGGFSDISQHWQQLLQNNTSGFNQQLEPNQQIPLLPSSTDSLQLMNSSSHSPSIWNTGGGDINGQGWAGLPALANMFHHMNIFGQGGTATPAAAGQYGMLDFDSSGMPSFPINNFDQMNTSGGGMSIGQGFPVMPPGPMFDITGGGSSSAWASMQLNFSSSTMESSTPEPKLMLGGMERPSMPRWTPSLTAGASSSGMSRRGAYGDFFSEADMAMINKDKRLKDMVNTDPKRVKRILNNRASVVKLKAQRHAEFLDLS
ncbi:unnamed protein product [Urochloa humidicola]